MAERKVTAEIGRDGVEAFLVKRVKALGGMSIKLAPIQAGIPDRLVMLPGGRMHLVEVKALDGEIEPIQEHWHKQLLERQGIKVWVLWGEEGVRTWLREIYALRPGSGARRPKTSK